MVPVPFWVSESRAASTSTVAPLEADCVGIHSTKFPVRMPDATFLLRRWGRDRVFKMRLESSCPGLAGRRFLEKAIRGPEPGAQVSEPLHLTPDLRAPTGRQSTFSFVFLSV